VKKKAHQELDELFMSGSSKSLIKTFNKTSLPTTLFIIFCSGGIDFVGGYGYYNFLKQNYFPHGEGTALVDT